MHKIKLKGKGKRKLKEMISFGSSKTLFYVYSPNFFLKVNDREYDQFVNLGERILEHTSSSYLAKSYLAKCREPVGDLVQQRQIQEPKIDEETGMWLCANDCLAITSFCANGCQLGLLNC